MLSLIWGYTELFVPILDWCQVHAGPQCSPCWDNTRLNSGLFDVSSAYGQNTSEYLFSFCCDLFTKASLLAGVGFCFSNVLPGDWIQLAWFFMPNWLRGPLVGNDFSSRTCTPPPPRVQTPLRPFVTENGNSLEKGVNIQIYRHGDVDIDIVYMYI